MMVCENEQLLANHTTQVAPSDMLTSTMDNRGISKVFQADYRSDRRILLQRNGTGTPSGNLLLFDARLRLWDYLFLFSTYYDIDWLAISKRENWIAYRVDNFKVQWWFNYQGYS